MRSFRSLGRLPAVVLALIAPFVSLGGVQQRRVRRICLALFSTCVVAVCPVPAFAKQAVAVGTGGSVVSDSTIATNAAFRVGG